MAAAKLSRKTLDDLKSRHVAFLRDRLVSDQARQDWLRGLEQGYDWFLTLRVGDVVDADHLSESLVDALTSQSIREFYAPVFRDVQREILASAKATGAPVGDFVPPAAREATDLLLKKRDLIPDALFRKAFEHPAVEDAVHDTLYDALTQFNTAANPFFAEWGLPAIIKKMPIGGSMILASMEAVRSEFDRRLEPEIRKFLATFVHGATSQLTDLFLSRSGDPKFLDLRRKMVVFLYSQSISDLVAGVDDGTADQAGAVAEEVALHVLGREDAARALRSVLEPWLRTNGARTFGEWFESVGAHGRPNVDGWGELLWPHAALALGSPAMLEFLEQVTGEFYDGLASGK